MTVRLRLALTIVLAGLATAIGVIVTLAVAFQRFDHESAYQRADGFISRVLVMHPDLLDQHQRQPAPFEDFLRSLLLYDPDSHLYLSVSYTHLVSFMVAAIVANPRHGRWVCRAPLRTWIDDSRARR